MSAILPQISVVIPTCHRNELLAQCLDRLAPGVQTLPPDQYEVIVTDDGAVSRAEQMVRDRYPWVRWVAGPRKGPASNRNHGARLARAEWLVFTDDDCLPSSGWLKGYVQALGAVSVYEGKTTCEAGIPSPLYNAPINLTGGLLWACNFMIRASLFHSMKGFDESFTMPSTEDIDLRERIEGRDEPILFVDAAWVDHPPRLEPFGFHLGKKYQSAVQYWYKSGNRGSYSVTFLKHVKHRWYQLHQFRVSWDLLVAFCSLALETGYVALHLPRWQRQFCEQYETQRENFAGA